MIDNGIKSAMESAGLQVGAKEPDQVQEQNKGADAPSVGNDTVESVVKPEEGTAQAPVKEENKFDISSLNNYLGEGYSFENADQLKESLSYKDKVGDLTKKLEEKTAFEEKYNSLKDKVGQSKNVFANETIQKMNEILKSHPDKDPVIMNKILSTDFSLDNLQSQLDILLTKEQLDSPAQTASQDTRLKAMLQGYGVNIEDEEMLNPDNWSEVVKYRIEQDARKANTELSKMKDVKVPEEIDFDGMQTKALEELNSRKEKWTDVSKEIASGIDKIPLDLGDGDVIDFEIPESFREAVVESSVSQGMTYGQDPSEESTKHLQDWVSDQAKILYMDKMLKTVKNHVETKLKEKNMEEVHNEQKPNTTEAPSKEVQNNISSKYKEKHSQSVDWRNRKFG